MEDWPIAEHCEQIRESVRITESIADHGGGADILAESMHAVHQAIAAAAKDIALRGVEDRLLTRQKAGEILGVHPHTISRWLTARQTEQPNQATQTPGTGY